MASTPQTSSNDDASDLASDKSSSESSRPTSAHSSSASSTAFLAPAYSNGNITQYIEGTLKGQLIHDSLTFLMERECYFHRFFFGWSGGEFTSKISTENCWASQG